MDYYIVKRTLNSYHNVIRTHNKTVGSIIKHHRKEKNLTLEETSEDICSISYLCKVERNQLVPSNKILPKLVKRLNINESEFNYNADYSWISTIIENNLVPEYLLKDLSSKNDYRSKLIKFAYNTLNSKDTIKARKYYLDLTEYYEHFKVEELIFFLYLIMSNFYNNGRYFEVLKIYSEMKTMPDIDYIILNADILKVKSLYKINNNVDANLLLPIIYTKLVNSQNFEKIIELKNYELSAKAKVTPTEELLSELSLLSSNNKFTFDYIWFCHYYFFVKDFDVALIHISKLKDLKQHFYIMYLITLDKTSKKEELEASLLNPPYSKLKISYEIVYNYLNTKYFNNHQLSFVKKDLLTSNIITEEYVIIDYLINQSTKYLKDKHHYKETVRLLEKYNIYLKNNIGTKVLV